MMESSTDGVFTGIYTISTKKDEGNVGQDNLGHSIPELLNEPNVYLVPSQQLHQRNTNNIQNNNIPASININKTSIIEMTPLPSRPRLGRKTSRVIDTIIALGVGAWLILIELGIIPHFKRGFYCDDRSIASKSNGDTISASLIISSISFPLFIMWLVEAILYKPRTLKSTRLKQSFCTALHWYKEFLIGMIAKLFIVEAMKITIGELRPHFLDTCRPDAAINCTGSEYISDYVCTNTIDSSMYVRDVSKSFPSGHSSIALFNAIFLIWYLQSTVPKIYSKLLIPIMQSLIFVWAVCVSLSRITDNRHHWWDVLVGAKMGVIFAVLTCVFLCKNFKRRRNTADPIIENGNGDRNHTSVRRLLSDTSCKDEITTMNNVIMQ